MADPRPTRGQWKAIQELDKHLTVSAGAGAGKTWVLTERYAAMLAGRPMVLPPLELEAETAGLPAQEPSRPNQIVAITFTKEAAGEMKARIRGRLRKWKEGAAEEEQRRIALLKEEVERATITTIHGYCSELLRTYPIEAGVDPQFRVLEDSESGFWLEEAVREVLDEGLALEEEWAVSLVTEYGYEPLVRNVTGFYPGLREQTEDFAGIAAFTLAKLDELNVKLAAQVDLLERLVEGVLSVNPSSLDTTKASVQRAVRLENEWPHVSAKIAAWRAAGFASDREMLALLSDLGEGWGRLVKALEETVKPLKEHVASLGQYVVPEEVRQATRHVGHLLDGVHRAYSGRKMQERALDFTDLQNRAVTLLQQPAVRRWQAERLRFLMVDEFQDTNPIQKRLLDALSQDNDALRLFVVGDAKQSIYRFRGADLEVFLQTQEEVQDRDGEHVSLAHNFRTQEPIISFINRFFEALMVKEDGDPLYVTPYEKMEATRVPAHEQPMVELLHLLPQGDLEQNRLREAEVIAQRIKDMVGQERLIPDGDGLRPVRYGDVTLLFSAMTNLDKYEYALQAQGIPYYIIGSKHFFDRQEVQDLALLLQAVIEGRDLIALIGTLRSPLFGVSDEALYWLGRQGLLSADWTASPKWERIALDDRAKLARAQTLLHGWRQEKAYKSAGDLLASILEQTGFEQALLLTFGGTQKVGNVRKLLQLAYEQPADRAGILSFLQHLNRMIEGDVKEEDAQVESEHSDVVKIMTIHKSKGLEFPVVILPDLGREFNLRGGSAFRYDPDCGLVLAFSEHDEWNGAGYAKELTAQSRRKALEEERRKLYVAMTRARDYLLLVGTRDDQKASGKKKEPDALTRDDTTWFEWLVAVLGEGFLAKMEGNVATKWPEVKWKTELAERDGAERDGAEEYGSGEIGIEEQGTEKHGTEEHVAEQEQRQSNVVHADFQRLSEVLEAATCSMEGLGDAGSEVMAAMREAAAASFSAVATPAETTEPDMQTQLRQAKFPLLGPLVPHADERPGVQLSVSALMTYLTCPRQYFYKYEWKLPEHTDLAYDERVEDEQAIAEKRELALDAVTLSPTERGTLVHRVLELLEQDDQLDDLLDRALAERKVVGEEAKALHAALRPEFDKYLSSDLFRAVQTAAEQKSELMFRLSLGKHEITGIIDKAIRQADGRALVLDYKTNRVFTAAQIQQATNHYAAQLQLYTLVVQRLLNWNPVEQAVLYFTASGRTAHVPIAEKDLQALEQNVRNALDHIAAHEQVEDFTTATTEHPCAHCGYRFLCKGL